MKHLLLLLSSFFIGIVTVLAAPTISNITVNQQADNVLRYDIGFSTASAAIGFAEYYYIDGTDTIRNFTNYTASGTSHSVTIRGLVQQTTYQYRIAAFDGDGISYSTWASFTTAALPFGLPAIQSVDQADISGTEGYVLTTTIRFGGSLNGQTAQIYDRKGNLVWYQFFDSLYLNPKYAQCEFAHYLGGTRMAFTSCNDIVELDFDGSIVNTATLTGADTIFMLHHDVIRNRRGNYSAIAAEPITIDFSGNGGPSDSLIISESVLEIDQSGNVLFEWQARDDYDTINLIEEAGGNFWAGSFPGSFSWLHANGMTEDLDGGLIVSFRKSNEIVKINPNNGDLVWRLGGPNSTYTVLTSNRFKVQHCPTVTAGNRYMVFDNTGINDTTSRVTEFLLVDYNTSTIKTWEYVLPLDAASNITSSAYNLKNGKILIGSGVPGKIALIDSATGTKEFEMTQSEGLYRASHVASLYESPESVNFSLTADNLCIGDSLNLQATPAGGFFSGDGVSGNIVNTANLAAGTYTVSYTYGTQKVDQSFTLLAATDTTCVTGIFDLSYSQLAFSIYPNPTNGTVNIELDAIENPTYYIIIGLNGQEMLTGTLDNEQETIDINTIPAGVYLLKVQNETGLATKKLVVY